MSRLSKWLQTSRTAVKTGGVFPRFCQADFFVGAVIEAGGWVWFWIQCMPWTENSSSMPSLLRLTAAHFSWFGLMMQPSYEWRPTRHSFPTRWLSCTKTRGGVEVEQLDHPMDPDRMNRYWWRRWDRCAGLWRISLIWLNGAACKAWQRTGWSCKGWESHCFAVCAGVGGGWGRAKKKIAKNDQKFRVRKHIQNHFHK